MILDIILAAIVFIWSIYGYRKGFIKQIFVLAGIVAISLGAAPMADLIEEILSKECSIMLTGRYVRGLLLAGCSALLYIIAFIVGRFLHATLVKGIPLAEKTNHVLGMVLSILASALAIFFILCIFSIGKEKINEYAPSAYHFIEESKCYQIADANNPVQHFDFFSKQEPAQSPKASVESESSHNNESEKPQAPKDSPTSEQHPNGNLVPRKTAPTNK